MRQDVLLRDPEFRPIRTVLKEGSADEYQQALYGMSHMVRSGMVSYNMG